MTKDILSFVVGFVRYGEFVTTACAAGSQYAATVGGGHALAESVLVAAFPVRGLKSPFHLLVGCGQWLTVSHFRGANIGSFSLFAIFF